MGKRGPKPGAAAERRRTLIAKRLVIVNDRELLQAQHLNEHLEDFLARMEQRQFPLSLVEPQLVNNVVGSTELLQGVIVEGIADRLLKDAAPVERGDDEPGILRGAYAVGRKRGR